MGTSKCPECGYSGQREVEERRKETPSDLDFVDFSRDYSVLVCPECEHEEITSKMQ